MKGVSRTFIHKHRKDGDFPEPIYLSSKSIALVRSSVEEWIQRKLHRD